MEVRGGDKILVTYTDEHTAEKKLKVPVSREVLVVGTAMTALTDGAFSETVNGVVLGKSVNVRITDADKDVSDAADKLAAVVEVYRPKTESEIELELAAKLKEAGTPAVAPATDPAKKPNDGLPTAEAEIDKWKLVDKVEITLAEAKLLASVSSRAKVNKPAAPSEPPAGEKAPPSANAPAAGSDEPVDDGTLHTGVFQATISLEWWPVITVLSDSFHDSCRRAETMERNCSCDPLVVQNIKFCGDIFVQHRAHPCPVVFA